MTRTFQLVRDVDVTGKSGTGVVAEGIEWSNGKVTVAWLTQWPSIATFDDLDDLLGAHGHEGSTRAVFAPLTVLGKVGELIAAGLPFTDLHQAGSGPERWVHVTTHGRDEWLAWLRALSAAEHPEDAAVQVEWDGTYDWQTRWMDPSGSVLVTYLSRENS
jgi:hypothetical protein